MWNKIKEERKLETTDEYIREWFKDHVVKRYEKHDSVEHLFFSKPNSSNYSILFIRSFGTLFVAGDLGDAVFQWPGDSSLEWISNCNLDYFKGKCQASEVGRDFSEWDEEYAIKSVLEYVTEYCDEEDEVKGKIEKLDESEWRSNIHSEFEWAGWLNENGSEVLEDQDYWEWAFSVGKVIHTRCRAHLIGLQEAIKKLPESEKPEQ